MELQFFLQFVTFYTVLLWSVKRNLKWISICGSQPWQRRIYWAKMNETTAGRALFCDSMTCSRARQVDAPFAPLLLFLTMAIKFQRIKFAPLFLTHSDESTRTINIHYSPKEKPIHSTRSCRSSFSNFTSGVYTIHHLSLLEFSSITHVVLITS